VRADKIGSVVEAVKSWNPHSVTNRPITYLDLSSVDNKTKLIIEPTIVDSSEAPSRARQLVSTGDVMVSTVRPNLNAVAWVSPELDGATASTGFCVLRPREGHLDSRYLFHWVRTQAFVSEMARLATGASYPAVSDKIILGSAIPLPPIEEQRRIASILDAVDALRTKRRQALAKLDTLTQAIFIDMFGDLRFAPGKGCALTNLAELQVGYAFKSSTFTSDGSGVRICRGINVLPGEVSWRDTEHVPDRIAADQAAFSLKEGDVVVAMDRPWIGSGFKAAKVSATDAGALLVQRVARLRSLGELPAAFLYELIRSPAFTRHCAPTETTIPHISPKDFRSFELERPDLRQAAAFGEAVGCLDKVRHSVTEQARGTDALFAALQHRAFRGEL
jgi:type I restriction enzyme S subunit